MRLALALLAALAAPALAESHYEMCLAQPAPNKDILFNVCSEAFNEAATDVNGDDLDKAKAGRAQAAAVIKRLREYGTQLSAGGGPEGAASDFVGLGTIFEAVLTESSTVLDHRIEQAAREKKAAEMEKRQAGGGRKPATTDETAGAQALPPAPPEVVQSQAGRLAAAEEKVLAKSETRDAGAYASVAEQYALAASTPDARRTADIALRLDPGEPRALGVSVRLKAGSGDLAGAREEARRLLARQPGNALAGLILGHGDALGKAKVPPPGARSGDAAGGGPGAGVGGGGAGDAGYTGGYTAQAIPPAARRFHEDALSKLRVGDRSGALLAATRAVGAAPDSPAALLLRARISRELGNTKGAIADADKALSLAPDDPNALRERALALLADGRYADALADLDRAAALDPANGPGYLYRAMVYEKLGRAEEARADLARAVERDPALKPLADEVESRLGGGAPSKSPPSRDGFPRERVQEGALVLGALSFLLAGFFATAKGRGLVTTATRGLLGGGAEGGRGGVLSPGDLLGGYRVVRELGRGGMGLVYEAEDTALQRRVAVKSLSPELAGSGGDRERFLREARAVAKLHHPRLVQIFSVLTEGEDLYLVFELVDGRPLDRVLESGRLPAAQARRVVADVAAALTCVHEHRIIHRDLKPANVVLEPSGAAKVMDFGIAHQSSAAATALTRTSASGTPLYMAPEQAFGTVSKSSDLYALGVLAYELITGRRPFDGEDHLRRKLNGEFPSPSATEPSLPRALDAFFAKALDPEPSKRFSSAQELARAFDAAAG